jgi:hypothetical protein
MPKLITLLTMTVELHDELPDAHVGTGTEERHFADINRALMAVPAVQKSTLDASKLFFHDPADGVLLRACPFCGKFAPVHVEECTFDPCPDAECDLCEERAYRVICDPDDGGCGSASGWYDEKEAAADGWNGRADV